MYVCMCEAVTDHEIRRAVENGASSVSEVMACTRAGTKCGACRAEIAELVDAAAPRSCRRRLGVIHETPAAAQMSESSAEAA